MFKKRVTWGHGSAGYGLCEFLTFQLAIPSCGMSDQNSAVSYRIDELRNLISSAESSISQLDNEIAFTASGLQSELSSRKQDQLKKIQGMNEFHRQDLDSEIILTSHYKDTANETAISSIMKQQDVTLSKEKETMLHKMLHEADDLLKQMEKNFVRGNEERKNSTLQKEEDEYLTMVQRAIVSHRERMLSIVDDE